MQLGRCDPPQQRDLGTILVHERGLEIHPIGGVGRQHKPAAQLLSAEIGGSIALGVTFDKQ